MAGRVQRSELWRPTMGIRFATSGGASATTSGASPRLGEGLYPKIDLSRWVHTEDVKEGNNATGKADVIVLDSDDDCSFVTASEESTEQDGTAHKEAPEPSKTQDEAPKDPSPTIPEITYKICEKALTAARLAKRGTPMSYWSYELYRGPPQPDGTESRVKVHYCRTRHTAERVMEQYFMDEPVLGFDLEWMANARKTQGPRRNVSLIQLASPSRIGLFHVAMFPQGVKGKEDEEFKMPLFKKVMESDKVSKAGVNIKGDCTRLRQHLGIDTKGVFELSHLYKLVKFSTSKQYSLVNRSVVALAAQVEEHMGLTLFKGNDVRSGPWEKGLSMAQVIYSASDAYSCLQLYHILDQKRRALNPVPPRPAHAELGLPIQVAVAEEKADEAAAEDAPAKPSPAENESMSSPKKAERDQRLVDADRRLEDYRELKASSQTTIFPAALRAYFVWRFHKLPPAEVAKLLRDPPLQTNTVVSYILFTIRKERLSYDKARVRTEVLSLLPEETVRNRFASIARAVSYGA